MECHFSFQSSIREYVNLFLRLVLAKIHRSVIFPSKVLSESRWIYFSDSFYHRFMEVSFLLPNGSLNASWNSVAGGNSDTEQRLFEMKWLFKSPMRAQIQLLVSALGSNSRHRYQGFRWINPKRGQTCMGVGFRWALHANVALPWFWSSQPNCL